MKNQQKRKKLALKETIQIVPFQFLNSHVKGQPQLGNAISGAIKENSIQGMRLSALKASLTLVPFN